MHLSPIWKKVADICTFCWLHNSGFQSLILRLVLDTPNWICRTLEVQKFLTKNWKSGTRLRTGLILELDLEKLDLELASKPFFNPVLDAPKFQGFIGAGLGSTSTTGSHGILSYQISTWNLYSNSQVKRHEKVLFFEFCVFLKLSFFSDIIFHKQILNTFFTNLHLILFHMNLNPIVQLHLVKLKFIPIQYKFQSRYLNSIQNACNVIQYFHSNET
jgi:hypothetical protein